ncbi:Nitrogenase molybdenum-iron protein beta chain [Desulfonema limicola]|uniref:Nitrogenase molybdenum-iron protein beta chain n=1 Tax=Desulfonema limicola TaxID=45656 RepID=A0A975BDK8_9BACT|nr:nitrogenase component 1 [Desulfonema limicola]QTA83402.1 Nitrogenase molybdenum-iron protein beta chain [Desulfonema limicola]
MNIAEKQEYTATKNACKLCAPLGASLVFKGIQGAVPLLHGSQGCSTYIRRYLISHFKEPIDIACSNFAEETAIFGGGANLKIALENIRFQYSPEMVGIATTCLSETIGDDVPMFIKEYKDMHKDLEIFPLVHVSTPSYQGTHMQGFHAAVQAAVNDIADGKNGKDSTLINIFPGMVSPEDMRYLKEIFKEFNLSHMMLPDYSETLDGPLWKEYQRIPQGGTKVSKIRNAGSAAASLEFGTILACEKQSAGRLLEKKFDVPNYSLGFPIGVNETDKLFKVLEQISGIPMPRIYAQERGRLVDSYVDAHKYVIEAKAVVYGEEDLVCGLVSFLSEIGIVPVICASGGKSGFFKDRIAEIIPGCKEKNIQIIDDADFTDIENAAKELKPDIFIGSSKGYSAARRLNVPLVRVGFPVHDRVGGARLLHLGYRGTQQLFDRITNTIIEKRQESSSVGYSYM